MKKLLILLFSILLSFNSYGEVELDFSSDTFCTESPKVQIRNNLYYLPNTQKPYSGENLCVYLSNGQYYSQGKIKNGLRHGNWSFWHENGQIAVEGNFKKGELEGKQTNWHEDGWKESEQNYKNGKKDGKETWWDENGQIQSERIFIYDSIMPVSEYKYFYIIDNNLEGWSSVKGKIRERKHYVGNKLISSTQYDYYKNGQLKLEASIKDDKVNGKWTEWHKNGQKKFEVSYRNNNFYGKAIKWHKNGQISSEGYYLDREFGMRDAKWTEWSRNGHIYSERFYKEGKLDGKSTMWYEDGQIYSERFYKDGKLDGKSTVWNENGQIDLERIYKDDELVSEINHKAEREAEFVSGLTQGEWVRTVAEKVKSNWRYQGAEDDWQAEVYVVQDRDGTIVAVDVRNSNVGDSQKAKVFKDSIRRAVYKSSPLPSAPIDEVFNKELIFVFVVN